MTLATVSVLFHIHRYMVHWGRSYQRTRSLRFRRVPSSPSNCPAAFAVGPSRKETLKG